MTGVWTNPAEAHGRTRVTMSQTVGRRQLDQGRWTVLIAVCLLLSTTLITAADDESDSKNPRKRTLLATGNSSIPAPTPSAPPVCTADCGQGTCVPTGTAAADYVCACIPSVSVNSVPSDPKSKCTIPATNPCATVDCGVAGQCVRSASLTDYTCQCMGNAVQANPGDPHSKCSNIPSACQAGNPCGTGTCGTDGSAAGFNCMCPAGSTQTTPQSPCVTLTPAPTANPCVGVSCNKGGCVVAGGAARCVCDPDAVQSNPAQATSPCVTAPSVTTSAPVATLAPTPTNPCTAGTYQCPANAVGCVPTGQTTYLCACADDSRVNGAGQSCPVTPAATPSPPALTAAPQNPSNPTPAPANPTPAPTTLPQQAQLTQTPPAPAAATPAPTNAGANLQNPGQSAAGGSGTVSGGSGSGLGDEESKSSSGRDTGITIGLIALAGCLAAVAFGIMFWACRKKTSSDKDADVTSAKTPLHPPSKLTSNVPSAAQYAENLRARPTSPRVVPYLSNGDDAAAQETPTARELLRQPSSARSVRTSYSKR
ncbi:hypothetical protein KFL_002840080 [Klebsormidium nitens]|uniref:EGF-like domain-containing protein n=1 Tax=Klebsormidium nitens TaxID=105231 RepID=A0A1Y1IC92_KLENI|nr:hypothetical protein KFL_002840080 [Klebsormidium nitens]|eukprot:GAQ86357.1 hypothetical protein KFL_002840080 [Klebsormidium nitens]